jgi:2-haloacid dehalogenase
LHNKYAWLLFDADGTLFDYDRAETMALSRTFEQNGLAYKPAYLDTYARINAQMWLEFEQGSITQERLRTKRFERLFKAVGIDADPLLFGRTYIQRLAEGIYLIDGAVELLSELYGRFGLLLITNGIPEVQRPRLASSALARFFPEMVISGEVGAAKPAKRIFDVAFAKMGHPDKEEALIIGDSLTSDIQGGCNYGIDVCWFNPNGKPNDLDLHIQYEIQRLDQLLSIVGERKSDSAPGELE